MTLLAGTRLAAYEILAPLGAGGMGEVYRARDTRLGREVAVKVVSARHVDDPAALARFEKEARAVAALSHPNIVALHDFGYADGMAFAVMELLEGVPMDQLVAGGPLPWRRAIEIAASIADGLASAHARGVVHRDLKPANIFITREGSVKILDFGLAKQDPFGSTCRIATSPGQTEPGAIFGTTGYMSPEQVKGDVVDHRTDIFSLGCVLYEALAGRQAFPGNTAAETFAAILRDEPPELPRVAQEIPLRLNGLVRRCLDKDPNHRFQSARDLSFGLGEVLSDWPVRSSPAATAAISSALRPGPWIAACVLTAVAGIFWLNGQGRSPTTRRATAIQPPAVAAATRPILAASYDAYVRGRHALDKRSEPDLHEAVRFFQDSIDADPTYAPAYAGMADSYGQLGYGSYISPEDAFPRARAAARKALELDPASAEAHASLGFALMYYDWNFAAAESEFKRAIELNPDYAIAHQWYAYLLTAMDRPLSEARREIAIAASLDPLSVPINIDRAYILHYNDRNEEALRSVQLALEMNPKFAPGYFWLGRIYTSEGRYADAETALEHVGPLRTWVPAMAVRGYLHAKAGRVDEARTVLAEFDDLVRQQRYVSGYAIAVVYAGLGDSERVFSHLDNALRERSHWLVWLKRDPRWNEVRADRRFQNLVRIVGLP